MKKLKVEKQTTRKFNHDITDKFFGFIHNNEAYIIFKDIKGKYNLFNTTALGTIPTQYSNLEEYLTYLINDFKARIFVFDTRAGLFAWVSDTNRDVSMHPPIFGKELFVSVNTTQTLNTETSLGRYYVVSKKGKNKSIITRNSYGRGDFRARCFSGFTNANYVISEGSGIEKPTIDDLIECLINAGYDAWELNGDDELAKWLIE